MRQFLCPNCVQLRSALWNVSDVLGVFEVSKKKIKTDNMVTSQLSDNILEESDKFMLSEIM
jgi:hypothetical protein